jgi:hypothetical protein
MAGFLTNLLAQYAQFNLQPLWNNIGCALITVIYVKTVLEIAAFIRDRLKSAFVSRKFLHVFASCWILFWPLFDVSHWSWRLNILVPSVMSIKIFYKVSDYTSCLIGRLHLCHVQQCAIEARIITSCKVNF